MTKYKSFLRWSRETDSGEELSDPVDLSGYATEEYVDDAIDSIPSGVGYVGLAVPDFVSLHASTGNWNGGGSQSVYAMRITLAQRMVVRGAFFNVQAIGGGQLPWSLYETADPAAAHKVVSGTAVFGGTGWQKNPASTPTLVLPGAYMFSWMFPASGAPSLFMHQNLPTGVARIKSGVSLTDPFNFTDMFADNAAFLTALYGDLDSTGTEWW